MTNGTLLRKSWLDCYGPYLHWIAVSCDSAKEYTQKQLGRGRGNQVKAVRRAFDLIKTFNSQHKDRKGHRIRTKLNSVITRLNWQEDMSEFAVNCDIERWKIFQVLLISGENDVFYPKMAISSEQFCAFVDRHKHLEKKGITIAAEDNDAMIESYIMINPQGRFYQNKNNVYVVSDPISNIGVNKALQQVGFSEEKFIARGGLYPTV